MPHDAHYFFFDFFLPLVFFAAFLLLAPDLVLFFFPNAEAQLVLYFLLGPLRKMVISKSRFDKRKWKLNDCFDVLP